MGQIGSVYKQPEKREDDSCHSWRAPSKWKRGTKGSKKGTARGTRGSLKEGKESTPCIYVIVTYVKEQSSAEHAITVYI